MLRVSRPYLRLRVFRPTRPDRLLDKTGPLGNTVFGIPIPMTMPVESQVTYLHGGDPHGLAVPEALVHELSLAGLPMSALTWRRMAP